jgi:hypothetical protein
VAVDGDEIVGHVIATRGGLEPLGLPVLGLGPLGVRPARQRAGVGTVLVHALLAVAEAADERLVALLGSPDYYRRFGFVPAADLGITAPEPAWGEHFQARHLNGLPVQGPSATRSRSAGSDAQRRRTCRWLTVICLPPGSGPPGTGIRLPPIALIRRPRELTSAAVRLRGSFMTWLLSLRSGT